MLAQKEVPETRMSHPRLDIPKPPEPKEPRVHELAAVQRTSSLPQRGNSTLDLTGAAISQPLLGEPTALRKIAFTASSTASVLPQ